MTSTNEWQRAGTITVECGFCMVGDPGHVDQFAHPAHRNWDDLCREWGESNGTLQLRDDDGIPGLGVLVETGIGDGIYDVEVRRTPEGRVAELRVVFIS